MIDIKDEIKDLELNCKAQRINTANKVLKMFKIQK